MSTALQVYRSLENRGVVEARPKSGYYVAPRTHALPEPMLDLRMEAPSLVNMDQVLQEFLWIVNDPLAVPSFQAYLQRNRLKAAAQGLELDLRDNRISELDLGSFVESVGHRDRLTAAAVDPQGELLATAARDVQMDFTRAEKLLATAGEGSAQHAQALGLQGLALGRGGDAAQRGRAAELLSRSVAVLSASELFRIPLVVSASSYVTSVVVVAVSTLASAVVVTGKVNRLDLVSVLKTRD